MFQLIQVCKDFDGHQALKDIHLSIPKGKTTCLIGPSGSGKTTLLKLLNRLHEPTQGTIIWQDTALRDFDVVALRRSMGYVIQEVGLLPHLTVMENMTLVEKMKGVPQIVSEKRAEILFELVNLPHEQFKNRYPRQLSGGQQQRVGIARALMGDPAVLLMDEPFGALDPINRRELQLELKRLNEKLHKTIVMVTHDLREAFRVADLVVLLKDGEIVQAGSKTELQNHPANSYVESFLEAELS